VMNGSGLIIGYYLQNKSFWLWKISFLVSNFYNVIVYSGTYIVKRCF
jgi:hypothetical protein